MLKMELKYKNENELLEYIENIKRFATILKISKPIHSEVWSKVFVNIELK